MARRYLALGLLVLGWVAPGRTAPCEGFRIERLQRLVREVDRVSGELTALERWLGDLPEAFLHTPGESRGFGSFSFALSRAERGLSQLQVLLAGTSRRAGQLAAQLASLRSGPGVGAWDGAVCWGVDWGRDSVAQQRFLLQAWEERAREISEEVATWKQRRLRFLERAERARGCWLRAEALRDQARGLETSVEALEEQVWQDGPEGIVELQELLVEWRAELGRLREEATGLQREHRREMEALVPGAELPVGVPEALPGAIEGLLQRALESLEDLGENLGQPPLRLEAAAECARIQQQAAALRRELRGLHGGFRVLVEGRLGALGGDGWREQLGTAEAFLDDLDRLEAGLLTLRERSETLRTRCRALSIDLRGACMADLEVPFRQLESLGAELLGGPPRETYRLRWSRALLSRVDQELRGFESEDAIRSRGENAGEVLAALEDLESRLAPLVPRIPEASPLLQRCFQAKWPYLSEKRRRREGAASSPEPSGGGGSVEPEVPPTPGPARRIVGSAGLWVERVPGPRDARTSSGEEPVVDSADEGEEPEVTRPADGPPAASPVAPPVAPSPRDYPAGPERGSRIRFRDVARWDQAKKVLGRFFRAYVTGDVGAFRRQFARDMVQDVGIYTNAFLADHQDQTEISLDLQLLNYLERGEQMSVDLRWNRRSTLKDRGLVRVDTGECRAFLDRDQDYRIRLLVGRVPFGLDDPEVRKQARSGQLNSPPGTSLVPEVASSPSPAPSPAPVPGPNGPIRIPVQLDPRGDNVAALDLSRGGVRKLQAASSNLIASQPGEDLAVFILPNSAPGATITLVPLNGSRVGNCPDPGSLQSLRSVVTANLPGVQTSLRSRYWAVETGSGEYAFLQVDDDNQTRAPVSVYYAWTQGRPLVFPDGTRDCP